MDDVIYRQAASDAVIKHLQLDYEYAWGVREAINALPSAEPERRKGRWIETDDGWDSTYYVCSECGCPWTIIEGTPEDNGMYFCPNCGAEMRGGENETN